MFNKIIGCELCIIVGWDTKNVLHLKLQIFNKIHQFALFTNPIIAMVAFCLNLMIYSEMSGKDFIGGIARMEIGDT